jgi:hypothetical protein
LTSCKFFKAQPIIKVRTNLGSCSNSNIYGCKATNISMDALSLILWLEILIDWQWYQRRDINSLGNYRYDTDAQTMNIPYWDCQHWSGACCGVNGQPGMATVPKCWKVNRNKFTLQHLLTHDSYSSVT